MRLELDDVEMVYGGTTALSDVNLDIEDGEFFTLVGPSGCGKTTTLRLVAGFESPTAGSIQFDGREMRGVPPEARGVGVVFQNYALFPHMTVGENVAYGLRFSDPPGGVSHDERVAELLELVGLPDAADRDPTELSGGQQQRIALARALAPGPDLLLLDEPMSALDARLRERLRVTVKEIQSELDITTLYVTHDQEEALAVSDRIAVMSDGRVEQVGTPREVYRSPETRFVAEFVGDNNVFVGRAVGANSPHETKGVGDESADGASGSAVRVAVGKQTYLVGTDRDVETGDRVTFCVRPERMRVVAGGTGGPSADRSAVSETGAADGGETDPPASRAVTAANRLTGRVADAEFLGETTRVRVDCDGHRITLRTTDPLDGAVEIGFDAADAHVVEVEARRRE
ncbi:thiamine transport system ATP-binding protein [Halopelagius inordinatus]|uniref:Molybdate/tungstate import ATP-binding protein WtpC n=1 Tax=Halopelagius inordinatus TaxID=553467 RepID=A0A1I2L823_9EURY|nr:ABC transporter ATP-binding protein [Halopelagius inordinatus]SFF75474.1 thiamine transport system ATP-binding protein [Halopelagius inordinatus]